MAHTHHGTKSYETPKGLNDLKKLPVIDYANHPAYGLCFPKPSFSETMKAVFTLLPWFGVVAFKKAMLMDRIPALPNYSGYIAGGFAGRLRKIPQYLPYIFKGFGTAIASSLKAKPTTPEEHKEYVKGFLETGFGVDRFQDDEMDRLRALVAQAEIDLRAKRAAIQGPRTFEDNVRFFNTGQDKALFDLLNHLMEKHGMIAAANAYIGRETKVTHLLMQINDPADSYFHGNFKDINLEDTKCNYMHVDTSYDQVKCAIYLNEVDLNNGAFSYVLNSHHARPMGFEGLLRRALDRSNLSSFKPPFRKMFNALPKALQKKCTFGADLLDGSPDSEAMLQNECYLTSQIGNVGLFANNGVHRGGLTKTGERIVFFATIG